MRKQHDSYFDFSDNKQQEQLWKSIRKGVFNAAICYFKPKNFLRNQLEELAEDVTHDILEKLMIKQTRFDASKASFNTWAMHIARNHFNDVHRTMSKNQYESIEKNEIMDVCEEYDFTPEKLLLLIKYLAPIDRKLLELKFLQRKSGREIAELMNLKENTVPMNIKRAKEKLRKIAISSFDGSENLGAVYKAACKYSRAA